MEIKAINYFDEQNSVLSREYDFNNDGKVDILD